MNPNDFGWRKKDDPSTFFPDSWSEEKIKEEIAWAWGNRSIKNDLNTGKDVIFGTTKEGYKIQFRTNDGTLNGTIISSYANFNLKFK